MSLIKREIYNIKLLGHCFIHFGFKVGFWSLVDGIFRRLKINKLYHLSHYKRYESCKRYLKKKYSFIIDKYRNVSSKYEAIGTNAAIWQYWHQGFDNCPKQVKLDFESFENKIGKHKRNILNENSYHQYINIPNYIEEKFRNGKMNIAVFSDFMRIALLKEHGGIWIDSTFYLNRDLPDYIFELPFFSIKQYGKRTWVVTKDLWSVGVLSSPKGGNVLINFCYDFLCEYWKKETMPIGYLMTDCIIALGYENIIGIKELIDQVPNNNKYAFEFVTEFANRIYDEDSAKIIKSDTYLYQLSYKNNYKSQNDGHLTNYGVLVNK